jgi:hypothetical protein
MPSLDTYHGPAASDGPPCAPGPQILQSTYAPPARRDIAQRHEHRLNRLTDRLPRGLQATVRWLRRPSSRWVRIPVGLLLIGGGILGFLPLLGLWMLPLGLILLAEDVPLLRTWRDRILDWIERRRPHWLRDTMS